MAAKIISLTVARNEEWVIGLSLRAALSWVDYAVVLVHASTDRTFEIVCEIAKEARVKHGEDRVLILQNDNPVWMEMDHRQWTLDEGRKLGGTHFAIVDADEVPSANVLPKLRGWVETLKPGGLLDLPLLPVWGSLDAYRCDPSGMWQKSWLTLAFCDTGKCFWKAKEDGYQYHNRPPYGTLTEEVERFRPVGRHLEGGVMHLQFANQKRLIWKHIFYQMDEVIRWPGREPNLSIAKKYSVAVKENGLVLRPCPKEWWNGYDKELADISGSPWHESWCREMIQKYGPQKFKGINFFNSNLYEDEIKRRSR
jgi:hypothetical protein